ncbi:SDR family oxidoreductase [Achromobacter spanius]|uniref:Short-chain dehydrogenase n=1 Tax=Achromobacter spanius TaxID=217203 RepID=A0AAW3HXC9_9BURK|nr:SDR family oxidoreductase [Achromobacter spanius]KNE24928.1 short-chain dehydrogenase [Achromobacter spanius]MCW3155321.1 SDR family oxidoreductase [Achromobacter spanius]
MNLKNAVVLITGANRGLGLAFARVALARGARKVYAAARDPSTITLPGVEAIKLDVSNPADVAAAAAHAKDVTLVINNAGIAAMGGFLDADAIESAQRHLDINVFGSLRVAQAFAPVLAANGGGALLNVLSIASWINGQPLGLYAMSKSAAWAMTNGLRHDLRAQGTQVLGLHMGFVDTDLTKGIDAPKSTPDSIVNQAFDGLEAGAEEVLADERTRQVKQGLSANPSVYL